MNWLPLLPITLTIWYSLCMLMTYAVSVHMDHVYPFVPYISDTGVYAPESCIFAQMMNMGCFLMGATVYVRYLLLDEVHRLYQLKRYVRTTNITMLWFGAFAVLGVSIVGNFQEKVAYKVHFIGAGVAYNLGTVYLIMQVLLSIWTCPHIGSKIVIIIRICIVVGFCLLYMKCFAFAVVSWEMSNVTYNTKWSPDQPGHTYHVISAVDEWIMSVLILLFFLTFAYEFRDITISKPDVVIEENVEIIEENAL